MSAMYEVEGHVLISLIMNNDIWVIIMLIFYYNPDIWAHLSANENIQTTSEFII